jgi:glycosyltransferase involved in cell wall biosynthesis
VRIRPPIRLALQQLVDVMTMCAATTRDINLSHVRLLYVTEGVPNRDPVLGNGSSMIPYEIIRSLPGDVSISLLTFEGPVQVPDEISRRCDEVEILPTRHSASALALSVIGSRHPGTQERRTRAAAEAVARLSSRADVTLLHGPHVLFLAERVEGPLVCQTVDPWSLRLAMERDLATGWRARYRRRKSHQAQRLERRLPERARLVTVGGRDAELWAQALGRPVRSIPNGVTKISRTHRPPGPPTVCFVGSLNYEPNIDSARTLVEKVAPRLWLTMPDLRIVIAGRQPVPEVLALAGERVSVLANVASVAEIYQQADVAVFPDEHGLGIRNSVLEAIAAGTPVVATPAAAREQDPHPLLAVEPDIDGVVGRVAALLHDTGSERTAVVRSVPAGVSRSWDEAASDYYHELLAAGAQDQEAMRS